MVRWQYVVLKYDIKNEKNKYLFLEDMKIFDILYMKLNKSINLQILSSKYFIIYITNLIIDKLE